MVTGIIVLILVLLLFFFLNRLEIAYGISKTIKKRKNREKRKSGQDFIEWFCYRRFLDIIPKSKLFRYYANILLFPICLIAVILFDVFQMSDTFGRTVVTLYFLVSAIPFVTTSRFDDKK